MLEESTTKTIGLTSVLSDRIRDLDATKPYLPNLHKLYGLIYDKIAYQIRNVMKFVSPDSLIKWKEMNFKVLVLTLIRDPDFVKGIKRLVNFSMDYEMGDIVVDILDEYPISYVKSNGKPGSLYGDAAIHVKVPNQWLIMQLELKYVPLSSAHIPGKTNPIRTSSVDKMTEENVLVDSFEVIKLLNDTVKDENNAYDGSLFFYKAFVNNKYIPSPLTNKIDESAEQCKNQAMYTFNEVKNNRSTVTVVNYVFIGFCNRMIYKKMEELIQ